MKPKEMGIFAPGTNMAVHRGDRRGGQGIAEAHSSGNTGLVPYPGFNRVGDQGTVGKWLSRSVELRQQGHHPPAGDHPE